MKQMNIYLVCLTVFPFIICTGIIYSMLSLYMASLELNGTQTVTLFTDDTIAWEIGLPF